MHHFRLAVFISDKRRCADPLLLTRKRVARTHAFVIAQYFWNISGMFIFLQANEKKKRKSEMIAKVMRYHSQVECRYSQTHMHSFLLNEGAEPTRFLWWNI